MSQKKNLKPTKHVQKRKINNVYEEHRIRNKKCADWS